ncbi:DUF6227 family protein [Streptomyces sp. NPDC006530]|uniref:DUF6227 family protein n=1 Tax=Streptomyces sp. NPDC006530 TaxID=3364750 RepID=UPI00369ED9D4
MLHVPHPLDGERGPGEESAQDQLAALLGRAPNSFDLPDELVERLDLAMAHTTSLHSSLHTSSAGPGGHRLSRETYRHCYLLLDGTTVTLWELAHYDGRQYAHEVYAAEEDARLAAVRLRRRVLPSDPAHGADDELEALERELDASWIGTYTPIPHPDPAPGGSESVRNAQDAQRLGDAQDAQRLGDAQDAQGLGDAQDLADLRGLEDSWEAGLGPDAIAAPDRTAPPAARARPYAPADSADHARRLLRRAENPDRPGRDTALRLRAAHTHRITQAFGRHCRTAGRDAAFTLYEHAFLLLDGSGLSLWEVEHTATPDGRHMCEVYATEHAARAAMERRAHVS